MIVSMNAEESVRVVSYGSEHDTTDADIWDQPWAVAGLIFIVLLGLLLFARCIFAVCEISCELEEEQQKATATQTDVELSLQSGVEVDSVVLASRSKK